MRKHFFILIITPILFTASYLLTMEPESIPTPETAAFFLLGNNVTLQATDHNCRIINPDSSTVILYDKPVHRAIMDDGKQRVGLVCDDYFLVYDINTRKELWRHHISHYEDYSVAFNHVDNTIFLRHENYLISDKYKPILLRFAEPNKIFHITPHPTKNAIFYPSLKKKLALLSLDDNRITYCPGKIENNVIVNNVIENNVIKSALYSNCGRYVIFQTHNNKVFWKDVITNKIVPLIQIQCYTCFPFCVKILPQSSIITIWCENGDLHFFNLSDSQRIITANHFFGNYFPSKTSRCLLDFSPDGTLCAAKTDEFRIIPVAKTILNILGKNKSSLAYWILKNYSQQPHNALPQDIINLLVKILFALYEQT